MKDLRETSYPYLAIAELYALPYWVVLCWRPIGQTDFWSRSAQSYLAHNLDTRQHQAVIDLLLATNARHRPDLSSPQRTYYFYRCFKCHSPMPDDMQVKVDAEIAAFIADSDTAGAHLPLPDCPACGCDEWLIVNKGQPKAAPR